MSQIVFHCFAPFVPALWPLWLILLCLTRDVGDAEKPQRKRAILRREEFACAVAMMVLFQTETLGHWELFSLSTQRFMYYV